MNKLIAILLLSTVTCFGGSKFVRGKFVSGAMPYEAPLPDLVVNNGTTLTIAANATYNYNNIILTNGGILQIANTNVLGWTIINCNKLKVYGGSVINGGYFTKWDQSSPTVTKTAPDGTLLSAVFQPHSLNLSGIAGGNGGAAGNSGDPNYSATEFNGASGGDGYCDFSVGTLSGGTAGTVSGSGDGGAGQSFTSSTTCGYFLNGSGGGGGRAGYSGEFIYLNIKQYFEPSIDTIVQLGGEDGYAGGDSGDCNFDVLDYAYQGYGGGGGAAGNGGVLVIRKPTEATISCGVYATEGGNGGAPGLFDYNGVCYDAGSGGWGETGAGGIDGSLTFLNNL